MKGCVVNFLTCSEKYAHKQNKVYAKFSIDFMVIVHFDGSRNWSLSVDPDFYTKNLPLFHANLNNQVHCNGSRFWVHTCNPVFLKNQVHVYGSKFWVHTCNPVFLKHQVHEYGSKFWVHTCNPVFSKDQVHVYGSKFWVHICSLVFLKNRGHVYGLMRV